MSSDLQRLAQQAAAARAARQAPSAPEPARGAEAPPRGIRTARSTQRRLPAAPAPRSAWSAACPLWALPVTAALMLVAGFTAGSTFKMGTQLQPVPDLPVQAP